MKVGGKKMNIEKTPIEWIDKLFDCMTAFYGIRWTRQFDRWMPEALLKTQWQSALMGCSHEEIRRVLVLLKQSAQDPNAEPPHFMEFYKYAKGYVKPYMGNAGSCVVHRGDPDVAKRALAEINAKLRYKSDIRVN